jgi:hypothetical protein
MTDPRADPDPGRTTTVRATVVGRSVPTLPVLPLVAILGVVVGLVVGAGFAPRQGPISTPTPSAVAVAATPLAQSLSSSIAVASPVEESTATPIEVPPPGGLTLAQALTALATTDVGSSSPSAVISARIMRASDASPGFSPPDRWVWVFVVQGVLAPASCGGDFPAQRCTISAVTEMAMFDYVTGEFLEVRLPAYP